MTLDFITSERAPITTGLDYPLQSGSRAVKSKAAELEMQVRYMGFDQPQNARTYLFDVTAHDHRKRRFVVTVDVGLFRIHRIAMQEGPQLCAQKLVADLTISSEGAHELTGADLVAYAQERVAAKARAIESRKGKRRPKTPEFW